MPSLDIYSRDGGKRVRDLLVSFLSTILIGASCKRPIYLISPWLSDFILFDNCFVQYGQLFRNHPTLRPYRIGSEVRKEKDARDSLVQVAFFLVQT